MLLFLLGVGDFLLLVVVEEKVWDCGIGGEEGENDWVEWRGNFVVVVE